MHYKKGVLPTNPCVLHTPRRAHRAARGRGLFTGVDISNGSVGLEKPMISQNSAELKNFFQSWGLNSVLEV